MSGGGLMLLKDLFDFLPKSSRPASYGQKDGLFPFFTSSNVIDKYVDIPDYDGEFLIIGDGGTGNCKYYNGKFEAYQRTYVFSPFDSSHLYMMYYAVKDNMKQLTQGASGSTIKFLTKGMLESINVCLPDEILLNKFNDQCENVQFQIEVQKKMIENAKEARDRLLPKLMSGEIEV